MNSTTKPALERVVDVAQRMVDTDDTVYLWVPEPETSTHPAHFRKVGTVQRIRFLDVPEARIKVNGRWVELKAYDQVWVTW